tara:strand:+ start:6075 stop:6272 length:198 start_codon:yes stop_codon:yes gene_type:complete
MKHKKFKINGSAIGRSIIHLTIFLTLWFVDLDIPDFWFGIIMLVLIFLFAKLFIDAMGEIIEYEL